MVHDICLLSDFGLAPEKRTPCGVVQFRQEEVRLVDNGQSVAAVARTLGVVEKTLFNWVKAHKQGKLKGADSMPVSAEQMEISRRG